MEVGRAPDLFQKLVCSHGAEDVELLEQVATLTRQRADALRQQRTRKWLPASGQPFVLLIIDELAEVIAYQPDTHPRRRVGQTDGRRDPDRAFHTTDVDLDDLCAYVTASQRDAPGPLTGIEAA
jgi:hypothetical protein